MKTKKFLFWLCSVVGLTAAFIGATAFFFPDEFISFVDVDWDLDYVFWPCVAVLLFSIFFVFYLADLAFPDAGSDPLDSFCVWVWKIKTPDGKSGFTIVNDEEEMSAEYFHKIQTLEETVAVIIEGYGELDEDEDSLSINLGRSREICWNGVSGVVLCEPLTEEETKEFFTCFHREWEKYRKEIKRKLQEEELAKDFEKKYNK